MKKFFKLGKPEKVVLIVGILAIIVVLGLGYAKSKFVKEDTYKPVETVVKNVDNVDNATLTLRHETFTYAIGQTISSDPTLYFKDEEVGEDITFNFDAVDMTTAGTYEASATKDNKTIPFKVAVVAQGGPVFRVAHPNFIFYLETTSTIEEVFEYANPKAVDVDGNDVTNKIVGIPTDIVDSAQTQVYNLAVYDDEGNIATTKVTVKYAIK